MVEIGGNVNGLDDLLIQHGEFGKFQIILYIMGSSSIFFTCLNLLSWNFIGASLPHRCLLPHEDLSVATFNTTSLEYNDKRRFQCEYNNQSCNSYVYDTSQIQNSVVNEWSLVCDKSYIRATIGALPMAGYAIGGIVFGHCADTYGRKLTFFFTLFLLFLSGMISSFSVNYYMLAVGRTLTGVAASGVDSAGYIYAIEVLGPNYRTKAAMGVGFFKISCGVSISIIAFLLNFSWRVHQLVNTLPLILYGFCICFIPESPRWLLDKGKAEMAIKVLKKMFQINGTQDVNEVAYKELQTYSEGLKQKEKEHFSLIYLFSHKNIRIKTIILTYLMILCFTLYYIVFLDQSEISDNPYVAFAIPSFVAIPLTVMFMYSLDSPQFGRKKSFIFCILTAGVCFVIHPLLPHALYFKLLRSIISILGRSLVYCSINILQIFAFELFPTTLRGIGLSFIATTGRLTSSSAPYIILIIPYFSVAFGIALILGAFLCFLLPETAGLCPPATLKESEKREVVQMFNCTK